MKKLLTILSSVAMLTVSGGSVIACGGNKYDQKDDDGNSILIDGLGSLDINGGDIEVNGSISTQDILDQIISNNGDSTLRGKIISRFINLLSAQFLQKGANDIDTNITNNPYLNSGLKDALSNAYSELKSSVEADIKSEKDDYDDQYGKKADAKWLDMLKAKFPGINDKDKLETKYKEDKMLNNEDDNVNTRLLNILLNTNQLGVQWVDKTDLQNYLSSYNNAENKEEWFKNNLKHAQQLFWSTLDDHNYSEKIITDGDFEKFTSIFKEDGSTTNNVIKFSAPEDIDKLQTGTNYAAKGFLSNSQRFFLDKFYASEAPVAISQVTIAYASGGSMDNGIDYTEDFQGKTPTTDDNTRIDNVNKFLGNINDNFDALLKGTTYANVTNKSVSNLLTLSDSTNFSQMERNVVYDFISKGSEAKSLTSGEAGDFGKIVDSIKRESADSMYTVLGDSSNGILAYIDADGLQIVRIEGYSILKNVELGANTGIIGDTTKEDGTSKVDDSTAAELGAFKEFSDLDSDLQKLEALEDTSSKLYTAMNSHITNPYLKYLVNESLAKGISGAKTSFDIMEAVKSYVKISQPTSGGQFTYWTGLMDYFFTIQYAGEEANADNFDKFFGKCISTGDSDAAKTLVSYVESWIESVQIQEENDNIIQFIAAQEKEVKAIGDNSNNHYPKGTIATFDNGKIESLLKKWTVYDETIVDNRVDLGSVLKTTSLGDIKTSSDGANNPAATAPTEEQILDAAVAVNNGLNKEKLKVASITTTGATISAKSDSKVYKGSSISVTFTVSIPEETQKITLDGITFFSLDDINLDDFKGGWL
jgi:hypothetical protein